MTLKTLADVRELIKHVPKERRQFSTWRTVEKALNEAAQAPTRLVSRLRCAWCCQWRASSAVRPKAPPLPAALVRRRNGCVFH
jgi:hypothetical protein